MADIVWFITATSSGFGKAIAQEGLRRGHKVIATARDSSKLGELKAAGAVVMDLDVTSDEETLSAKLAEANAIYGKITHVVNPAGYILEGAIEEASQKEVLAHFNTNVFGTFNMARAAVPHLREAAKTGTHVALANFGSLGSWWSGPAVAHYCSTKYAVTGLSEGLVDELKPFGIDVCVVEPGYTRTGFLATGAANGDSSADHRVQTKRVLPVYDGTPVEAVRNAMNAYNGNQPSDVDKCAKLIVDVLTKTGVAEGKEVPVRLPLGEDTVATIRKKCEDTLKLVAEWEAVSVATGFDV
ncbi:hypothetical protein B0T17DRAFT_338018 [Bombardia bombarda]|uniref:Uncharacterized protein n=1 Tax=Bombardia bombarda TaxID=252184 RepID=A0AA39WN21_9PEZI|nr:hypothetical protein B0T17DRAFT_338018 [Bombardia bombarda]